MEKSWKQLSDRCQLFFDAPDGLYKELLKEGECELANRCSLHIQHHILKFRYNNFRNSYKLPNTFKSIHSVFIDGNEIPRVDLNNIHFEARTNESMKPPIGTPQQYSLANGFIYFDKMPTDTGSGSNPVCDIFFKASLQNSEGIPKSLTISPYTDTDGYCHIETTLGKELNGYEVRYIYYNTPAITDNILSNITFQSTGNEDFSDPLDIASTEFTDTTNSDHRGISFQLFRSVSDTWSAGVVEHNKLFTGVIPNYRQVAPVIDGSFHLTLCDYALYVASAKKNPALSDKHKMIWDRALSETLTENLDKELNNTIKEVI